MKDQYFGDVNDFRKYGLLRLLSVATDLRLGVCWMLTAPDGRADGNFLGYLDQREKYRRYDPSLFDWLHQVIGIEQERRTARIEASMILGPASYQSTLLTDSLLQRQPYFAECDERFAGCDLVFFDPDNGLEIKSTKRGRKNSCKFLFWDEVHNTFCSGASVLIYQHFTREERNKFSTRLAHEIRSRLSPAAVFTFRTPHVLFLLAAQERHTAQLRLQLGAVQANWTSNQIVGEELALPNQPLQTEPAP